MIKGRIIKEVILSCESHINKYGFRKMSKKEFIRLFNNQFYKR